MRKVTVSEKSFYLSGSIGKAKYTISPYDGLSTHKDGSPFFGIYIFSNKKKYLLKIKELVELGIRLNTWKKL